jgi:hypothetical protein
MLAGVFAGCGGSQILKDELSLSISDEHADAWINLMPGSQQTFFITGTLVINNYGDSTVNSIKIMKCLVSQNKAIIYTLNPELKDTLGTTISIEQGQGKVCTFSNPGVELKNEFNPEKPVDLMIYLVSSNKIKQVSIPGVKITKAY